MKRSKSLSYLGRRHIPLPTGRFVVGCLDIMTCYSKSGVFVRLYYPAQEQNVKKRCMQWPQWFPSKEYVKGCAIRIGVPPALLKVLKSIVSGDIFIPAVWHAALSEEKCRYPVVIFSHGLGAWRTAYSTICLEIASHGFIVASLEHRDSSACATFYKKQARMSFSGEFPASDLNVMDEWIEDEWRDVVDGQWTPRMKSQSLGPHSETTEWIYYEEIDNEAEKSIRMKQLRIRAQECVKVLDMLECLDNDKTVVNILDKNFPNRMFTDRFDFSRVAVAGHSFGGATAILSLANEKRFRVGIALDPWMLPFKNDQSALSLARQPLMTINTESFQDDSSLQMMSVLQRNDVERKFFTIRKAHHRDQCDVNFTRRKCFQFLDTIGKGVGRFTVIDLTSRLMLEFLEKHLDTPISEDCLDICSQRKKYLKEETFAQEISS